MILQKKKKIGIIILKKYLDNLLALERDNWFNDNAEGYLASDGFFPFRDNIDISS